MSVTLGLDLGTSKVAAAVVDADQRRTLDAAAILHNAAIAGAADRAEQDVAALLTAADQAVQALHAEYRSRVAAVGLTGQMHGVVLWDLEDQAASPLVTWQDQRCLAAGFLDRLRQDLGRQELHNGFGWATLAWLQQEQPELVARYARCGTIADYVCARITGASAGTIDPTHAHSWGLFDPARGDWDREAVKKIGMPDDMVPTIRPTAALAGRLRRETARRWGIREQIPVAIPAGDNPASIYATLAEPETELALTLGTGGQLAAVIAPQARLPATGPGLEYRPYVDDRRLAVSASLCGGRAFTWLVECVERWLTELGLPTPPRPQLYDQLIALGLGTQTSALRVDTSFAGERHDTARRGSITEIGEANLSLGGLARATCAGVLEGMLASFPKALLTGRTRVVASGNAIRRSPLMQQVIKEHLQLELVVPNVLEEAATGAGLLAADSLWTGP